jgi:hypothetical protein
MSEHGIIPGGTKIKSKSGVLEGWRDGYAPVAGIKSQKFSNARRKTGNESGEDPHPVPSTNPQPK